MSNIEKDIDKMCVRSITTERYPYVQIYSNRKCESRLMY